MAHRAEPEGETDTLTQAQVDELRNNLARLSGPSVVDFYRDAHRECAIERQPGAKAIQRLVTAWKILRKWGWK
ncbi:MAG: hypothetical protein LAP86_05905 [Acidobacteriia bacterium]|nr:hypothetical protein [Terriglobia bacterium]